ncbi:MAG: hypothetical protein J6X18_06840 [Bacteroidales bacterium]|nr:hypothetical protein [Bacteroidales bacterium]
MKNPNRKRKHIPYGSKGYCGYGGETYSKKYGVFITDVVDKKAFRQKIRRLLHRIRLEESLQN